MNRSLLAVLLALIIVQAIFISWIGGLISFSIGALVYRSQQVCLDIVEKDYRMTILEIHKYMHILNSFLSDLPDKNTSMYRSLSEMITHDTLSYPILDDLV